MAQKRMISLKVTDTDLFLDMPLTARYLYLEFCTRADDDGFIASPKKIQRMVGGSDDDFRILMAKQFIIPFESGVCVIKHWRIHNYIRSDRYTETIYLEEKSTLDIDESNTYIKACVDYGTPNVIPNDIPNDNQVSYQRDTQIRLGKNSIDKNKKDIYHFFEHASSVKITTKQYEKLINEYGQQLIDDIIMDLDNYIVNGTGSRYKDHNKVLRTWLRKESGGKYGNSNTGPNRANSKPVEDQFAEYAKRKRAQQTNRDEDVPY